LARQGGERGEGVDREGREESAHARALVAYQRARAREGERGRERERERERGPVIRRVHRGAAGQPVQHAAEEVVVRPGKPMNDGQIMVKQWSNNGQIMVR
jgi:hypothetical protein